MTREEASIIIGNIPINGDGCYTISEYQEAKAMAIEVLEREPCEDAISRKAVLDMATTIQTDDFSGNEIIEVVEVDDVKALPPVIPQTKTECSCEQIKWERDTAIAQHKELGYGLGEKPKTDVLDKIRAEIEQNAYPIVHGVNNHEKGMTLYGILQVIDKYRESEDKK